ncbi:MAG: PAS domain S-box protein [Rhodobacteraceae bacterium]|nr:PAS domain S-box protein [Paracoccaceae bacterium]
MAEHSSVEGTFNSTDQLSYQTPDDNFWKSAIGHHAIVSVVDVKGKITFVNEKFLEISGYDESELLGQNPSKLKSGEHSIEFYQNLWNTIKTGRSWTGEIKNLQKSGEPYWVKATIIPRLDERGKILKYVAIQTDVTEIKEAERLRQLDTTLNLTDDEIYMFWPENLKFFYANKKAIDISGLTDESILGFTPMGVSRNMASEAEFRERIAPLESGKAEKISYRTRRIAADGHVFPTEVTIQLIKPKDEPPRYVASIKDISEIIASELEIENVKALLDMLPVSVTMLDAETLNFCYLNKLVMDRFGWTQEEYLSKTPMDVLKNFDEEEYRDLISPLINQEKSTIHHELIDHMGVTHEVNLHYVKLGGKNAQIVTIARNLTKQKLAESKIQELRTTLDNVPDEIFMFWPDTKLIFFANQSVKTRLGMSDSEIKNLTPYEIEGGLPKDQCDALTNMMIEEGLRSHVFVRAIEQPNGEMRSVETNLSYIEPAGQRPRFLAINRDVTSQEHAREKIRQLDASLDLIRVEIYSFWPSTYEFTYLNQAALNRTGWSKDEWIGKSTFDAITPSQQERLEQYCEALIKSPEKSITYEIYDRTGTPLEVSLHFIAPEGEKPRFLSTYQDITSRKLAEKAKSEFVSTVSHELRTPLTSIKGALDLLGMDAVASDPGKSRKLLDVASINADRLAVLVNDILDWEKISAGRMTYIMDVVDLADIIRDSLTANQTFGRLNGVTYIATSCPEGLCVSGDAIRLVQVMTNLLSNAAKFSSKGASVEVSLSQIGENARIAIKDHGCGITKHAQATIFDRFTQSDSTDRRRIGGTGLGLSIVKAIIDAHEGCVDFISDEGKGSEFFFDLRLLAQN